MSSSTAISAIIFWSKLKKTMELANRKNGGHHYYFESSCSFHALFGHVIYGYLLWYCPNLFESLIMSSQWILAALQRPHTCISIQCWPLTIHDNHEAIFWNKDNSSFGATSDLACWSLIRTCSDSLFAAIEESHRHCWIYPNWVGVSKLSSSAALVASWQIDRHVVL